MRREGIERDAFPQIASTRFRIELTSTDRRRRYHFMNGAHFLYELSVLFERQCLRAV
jgi:hypothetical protein